MSELTQHHETFTIERVFPNCLDHVWAAWAIPEKKQSWFGGENADSDFRVGGTESKSFENDRGTHTNNTHYFEIQEGERIVFGYSMSMNGVVHTVSLTTVTFTEEDGGTRLSYTEQMCVIPPSDGAVGRTHGWNALLDALGMYLAEGTRANA